MKRAIGVLSLCGFLSPALYPQCVTFPANFVPLSSVSAVTAANGAGDHLVVGSLAGGYEALTQLALPDSRNQAYCDSAVQLAPSQFYPGVYVPSQEERSGDFHAFAGLLVNPASGQPFPGGLIPASLLGTVYAFRIGPAQVSQSVKGWSRTGTSSAPHQFHTAVTLPNGKVLIVSDGGSPSEVYDPATGVFSPTGRTTVDHSNFFSAVLLNDGRVLLAGGAAAAPVAELYDPATGRFTSAGQTQELHGVWQSMTLLLDGRVLLVGGKATPGFDDDVKSANAGAELFDPRTMTFTRTSPMVAKRRRHTATLLTDGRVLITGGSANGDYATSSAEIFNPATGAFTAVEGMLFNRANHFAVLLPNGKVLVGGGYGGGDATAQLFNPKTNSWEYTGNMRFPREEMTAVLLPSGQALVIGGYSNNPRITETTELYNPDSGTFTQAASMNVARKGDTATVLPDGRVLVVGGTSDSFTTTRSAETYTPTIPGLVTSQSGLTFRSAQGSATVTPQSIAVLSPADDIPWNVSVKTYAGGNWLSATPSSARSAPGEPPVTLTIRVDPTGLAPQDYYGAVSLVPTDQKHPPVTVTIVFSIVPAGADAPLQVSPTGLVFLTAPGTSPPPQSFSVKNFTSRPVTFTAATFPGFFSVTPLSGTITTALPGNFTVTVSSGQLLVGVYRGSIRFSFSDGSTQTVDILLVVSPPPAVLPAARAADASCTPAKLLPVFTSLAAGSTAPIAWPTALLVQVVDDCGNAIDTGSVIASFTNGDPPVSLIAVGNGTWSATWVPVHMSANTAVRLDAQVFRQPLLSGTVRVALQVASNPKVPVVAAGGVLSSGDYVSAPAAGLLVSIFGSALADGSAAFNHVPLPRQIGSTQVLLGALELPVVYVSEGQVNVLIPYDAPLNAPLPLLVTRASAISVPVTVAVLDAQPAILSTAGNGAGQGHIYKATSSGAQILADATSPATTGDVLVIYCVGLGALTPAIQSGDASPSDPLAKVEAPVTVTIGERTATPSFAGLTPGFVGLYQVNVVVPAGVTAGPQTPVNISVGGKSSPAGITMALK